MVTSKSLSHALLIELHALIADAAAEAIAKVGCGRPWVTHDSVQADDVDEVVPGVPMAELRKSVEVTKASLVGYPPGVRAPVLSRDEHDAIATLQLTPAGRSALEKLIADACAKLVFHQLCLIDGVGSPALTPDPPGKTWLGIDLVHPTAGRREMLHDTFGDLYMRYLELRDKKSR